MPMNITLIKQLYTSGLSTRQIAERLGAGKTTVAKICSGMRDRIEAVKLVCKPAPPTHWRTARNQARKIMEQHLGRKLDRTEHVHHKDHNWLNNSLDNLEVMDIVEHAKLHKPANPIPRHLRPERKAYMKAYMKNYQREKR